tara:strand:+ start:1080 stop:1769 length:690 start_codon:yes stop_codon:yes gene_type:complete
LKEIRVLRAGIIEHSVVSEVMRKMQQQRINEEIIDTVILVEHPEIVTIGAKAIREGVVIDKNYRTSNVDRGGGITWHGPGQLVLYPIIKWGIGEQNIREIIGKFEKLVIMALHECGVEGYRDPAMMGVWVDGKKICSIGLAFLHWVSRHGLAINYATPGDRIESLFCCGMDKGVTTSLEKLGHINDKTGSPLDRERLEEAIISNIEEVIDRIPQDPIEWTPEIKYASIK